MRRILAILAVCFTFLIAAMGVQAAEQPELEANKKLVRDFFTAVAAGDKASLSHIVREDYIQHAPNVETGLQGVFKLIDRRQAQGQPAATARPDTGIVRMVAEGDLVVAHLRREGPGGPGPQCGDGHLPNSG